MKKELWIGLAGVITLAVVGVIILGLALGWAVFGRRLWADDSRIWGPGRQGCPGCDIWQEAPSRRNTLSIDIDKALEAVKDYIADQDPELEVAEIMEFELNFYAIVREHDTGIGAMELLIDKESGIVRPEMGPNMMWNARYGGMAGRRGMMGRNSEENSISENEALEIAQRWLDTNRPGTVAEEHTDPFYGYYTIHTLRDDEIEGMLSVHGNTGQVWYHTWHGDYIQMIELDNDH